MQFAVNYSPQAATLLVSGKAAFDLFKCPDWADVINAASQYRPIYVHFPLATRPNVLEAVDWGQIEGFLKQTGTHYVNIHLAPHTADFPGMAQNTCDPSWRDQLMESVLTGIQMVVSQFGKENVIIENVPWDPDPKYAIPRPVIVPEFVNAVIDACGCGLLLDIAHARIAALYLGLDPIAYLDQMPTRHLKEVHITGTLYDEEMLCWRDHFPMTNDDWMLTNYALAHIQSGEWPVPEIIALEYGGIGPMFEWRSKSEVLLSDISHLQERLNDFHTN